MRSVLLMFLLASTGAEARSLAAGDLHSCAILPGGSVRCWGGNAYGNLGGGHRERRDAAVRVPGLVATSLASGAAHTCALRADGSVACWGHNGSGAAGIDPGSDIVASPVTVPGVADAVAIGAGHESSCAILADATLACWGHPYDSTYPSHIRRPHRVAGLADVNSVAPGASHICATTTAGQLFCWGDNSYGMLGTGDTVDSRQPRQVAGIPAATKVVSARFASCALTHAGQVYCWGDGFFGELGIGDRVGRLVPTLVPGLSGIVDLHGANHRVCARHAGGQVWCWGQNNHGELATGDITTPAFAPVLVPALAGHEEYSLGATHGCLRDGDGTLACWGANHEGQAGIPTARRSHFVEVATPAEAFVELAVGEFHGCGRKGDGTVACWGGNRRGQLGVADRLDHPTPIDLPGLSDARAIAAGGYHACALLAAGSVACWGDNGYAQLGGETSTSSAVQVVPGVASVASLHAGAYHTCARHFDDTVTCWGYPYGETPTVIDAFDGSIALATAHSSLCGLKAGGTLVCFSMPTMWDPLYGPTTREVPSAVGIAVTADHWCANLADGSVKCWGSNFSGQLGLGASSSDYVSEPTAVPQLTGVVSLSSAGRHTCAERHDGALMCWGSNTFGQTADGERHDVPSPTLRAAGVQAWTVGPNNICVIDAQGTRCSGYGYFGALGDGTLGYSLTPARFFPGFDSGFE